MRRRTSRSRSRPGNGQIALLALDRGAFRVGNFGQAPWDLVVESVMRFFVWVLTILFGPVACGGTACTSDFRFGLSVSVLSTVTDAPLCSATVIATDGNYSETLALPPFPADAGAECVYRGAGERAGTYSIDA